MRSIVQPNLNAYITRWTHDIGGLGLAKIRYANDLHGDVLVELKYDLHAEGGLGLGMAIK